MDYRGGAPSTVSTNGGGYGDYPSRTMSAITSPNAVRYSKSTGQPSPSSVIEELQGRFYNTNRAREKRPILKNSNAAELAVTAYHRQTTTPQTSRATLASRPHHQSELTLASMSSKPVASAFEPPYRSITAASTTRLANAVQDGGPSFRPLETVSNRGG